MRMKKGDLYPFQYDLKWDDGNPISLTDVKSIKIKMRLDNSDTLKVDGDCTIISIPDGRIQYQWVNGDTDTIGMYQIEFVITYNNNSIVTVPSDDIIYMLIVDSLK